jgi:hypothetical protein
LALDDQFFGSLSGLHLSFRVRSEDVAVYDCPSFYRQVVVLTNQICYFACPYRRGRLRDVVEWMALD